MCTVCKVYTKNNRCMYTIWSDISEYEAVSKQQWFKKVKHVSYLAMFCLKLHAEKQKSNFTHYIFIAD